MQLSPVNNASINNTNFKGTLTCRLGNTVKGARIPDGMVYQFLLDSNLSDFSGKPDNVSIQKLLKGLSDWTGIDLSGFKNPVYCMGDYNRFSTFNGLHDEISFVPDMNKASVMQRQIDLWG